MGDTACEVNVLREYEIDSARNTGGLRRDPIVERIALQQSRGELEQLLFDPSLSEETRQQARSSIREINTAINVVDKRPVLKETFELGLLAVDVITLGEFAGARVLTTSVVKQLVLSRTGKELSDDAAARVANNIYADSPGFAQAAQREFKPGTAARAENINAGQVTDRDGLPRLGEANAANNTQIAEMLGRAPEYWGTQRAAWQEGTMVTDRVVTQPETYRMVINEQQYQDMSRAHANGDMDAASKELGGWATKDPIRSMADVRGNLAISLEFKDGTLYSVEFTVRPGVGVREGTVGPMWDAGTSTVLPGGGRQAQFMQGRPAVSPSLFEIKTASIKVLR